MFRIPLKILLGPLLGVLTTLLGFALAIFFGKSLESGRQAKKDLKNLTRQIEVKNEIKTNIRNEPSGYAISKLRSKWSRNE